MRGQIRRATPEPHQEANATVATIYDVARAAGVSTATVSRALNSPQRVAARTRERVLRAAARLGYRPSALAQALTRGRSRTIGVLLQPEPDGNPYYQSLIETISRRAGAMEYDMVVAFLHGHDAHTLERALEPMESRRPTGYLVYARAAVYEQYGRMRELVGAPVVWLCAAPGDTAPVVCPDEDLGARLAMEHLFGLGHRRVAFACASHPSPLPGRREFAYSAAMLEARNDPLVLHTPQRGPDPGRDAARTLLERHRDVTAVLVRNDHSAFGVVSGLRERGIRVPEDISVVSFDDIPLARFCSPPLTTLDMRPADNANQALSMLLSLARGRPRAAGGLELVPPRLVLRRSTAPVRPDPELRPKGRPGKRAASGS